MTTNRIAAVRKEILEDGFSIVDRIYSSQEVDQILLVIDQVDTSKSTFRKTKDLFAIRQFLKEIPRIKQLIFTTTLKELLSNLFGEAFFVVKSIYFDKPENSNWFVSYHQDLTISVDKKINIDGFGPWTTKQNQFSTQPPLAILEDNFTIRIHLDTTNSENGALKVVPGSHLKAIYRPETIDWEIETERICDVPKGGVMILKPLLLHSSSRSTNNGKRRVIHIEFSRSSLPENLNWAEYDFITSL
jgi:ectoine hydroxylase-related dioxygenase (phytanoyl-CoA dioxygenase family)